VLSSFVARRSNDTPAIWPAANRQRKAGILRVFLYVDIDEEGVHVQV
jgi:hypothetical protein